MVLNASMEDVQPHDPNSPYPAVGHEQHGNVGIQRSWEDAHGTETLSPPRTSPTL